jgi:O-succinylbenzoate synthase
LVVGEQDHVNDVVDAVARGVEVGYVRAKLKIRPGWDVEPLRAVRSRFPALELAADANGAYTLDDAEGPWAALDELDLAYVEEPLRPGAWVELLAFRERCSTPVCLDESIDGEDAARLALHLGVATVFNVKIPRVGGVSAALAIHDVTRRAGAEAWVGGMIDGCVGRFHQLSLASLPGFTRPGDVGGTDRYSPVDLLSPPIRLTPAGLAVPSEAGVARRIDPDALRTATVRMDSYRPLP